MKTAEELFKTYGEASKFCEENGFGDFVSFQMKCPWKLANAILRLKSKQDKITRHACADNVEKLLSSRIKIDGCDVISINRACSAIINTKAI